MVAALVAPRPLLIGNTDSDDIFPLDGVYHTFESARRVYGLYGAADKVALAITSGPHKDTQELRMPAFRWFNHHLKGDDSLIEEAAVPFFEPEQLKVFADLPADQVNTKIQETFVPMAAAPPVPQDEAAWAKLRDGWLAALKEKSFAAWPDKDCELDAKEVFSAEHEGLALRAIDFTSQEGIRLRLYIAQRAGLKKPELVVLNVLNEDGWVDFLATMRPAFEAELKGETLPDADAKSFEQHQKMFKSFDWAMAYVRARHWADGLGSKRAEANTTSPAVLPAGPIARRHARARRPPRHADVAHGR